MNRTLFLAVALFTLMACTMFVLYNPNIATEYTSEFADNEVFMPENSHFDFRTFTINDTKSKNFTAKIITNGHIRLADDTGDKTINVIELNKMINTKRDSVNSFLNGELEKPSWAVDGITVHQIDFRSGDTRYSAYMKNSTTNTIIYISTPSEKETADMMNSLKFREE